MERGSNPPVEFWSVGAELVCSDLVSQGAELGEFHPALMCLFKLGEQAEGWAEPGCLRFLSFKEATTVSLDWMV